VKNLLRKTTASGDSSMNFQLRHPNLLKFFLVFMAEILVLFGINLAVISWIDHQVESVLLMILLLLALFFIPIYFHFHHPKKLLERLIGGTLGTLSLVMVVNLLLSFFQADNDYLREVFWKDLLGFIPVLLLFFGLIYASRVVPREPPRS
jgi:zinc transporter ZupT